VYSQLIQQTGNHISLHAQQTTCKSCISSLDGSTELLWLRATQYALHDRHLAARDTRTLLANAASRSQAYAQPCLQLTLQGPVVTVCTSCSNILKLYILPSQRVCVHTVAYWLRHYATSQKVAGSRPDDVYFLKIYLILPAALWSWGRLSL
jgi:hypothetical protein